MYRSTRRHQLLEWRLQAHVCSSVFCMLLVCRESRCYVTQWALSRPIYSGSSRSMLSALCCPCWPHRTPPRRSASLNHYDLPLLCNECPSIDSQSSSVSMMGRHVPLNLYCPIHVTARPLTMTTQAVSTQLGLSCACNHSSLRRCTQLEPPSWSFATPGERDKQDSLARACCTFVAVGHARQAPQRRPSASRGGLSLGPRRHPAYLPSRCNTPSESDAW
jgi:hypothetical protein